MFVVFDPANAQAFGPFGTSDEAWRWVRRQEQESGWSPEDPDSTDLLVLEMSHPYASARVQAGLPVRSR